MKNKLRTLAILIAILAMLSLGLLSLACNGYTCCENDHCIECCEYEGHCGDCCDDSDCANCFPQPEPDCDTCNDDGSHCVDCCDDSDCTICNQATPPDCDTCDDDGSHCVDCCDDNNCLICNPPSGSYQCFGEDGLCCELWNCGTCTYTARCGCEVVCPCWLAPDGTLGCGCWLSYPEDLCYCNGKIRGSYFGGYRINNPSTTNDFSFDITLDSGMYIGSIIQNFEAGDIMRISYEVASGYTVIITAINRGFPIRLARTQDEAHFRIGWQIRASIFIVFDIVPNQSATGDVNVRLSHIRNQNIQGAHIGQGGLASWQLREGAEDIGNPVLASGGMPTPPNDTINAQVDDILRLRWSYNRNSYLIVLVITTSEGTQVIRGTASTGFSHFDLTILPDDGHVHITFVIDLYD